MLKNVSYKSEQAGINGLPASLIHELQRMRRDVNEFSIQRRVSCQFGCGSGAAFALTHPRSPSAGSWRAIHGWLFFNSSI